MEKTKIGAVIPLNAQWSDIGSLKSLWEYEEKNDQGNLIHGKVILNNTKDCFFKSEERLLVGIGVENLVKHENDLLQYGEEILRKNNSVKLIGNPKHKGAVLSFTIDGIHPHDIATILDEDGVAIRAGHHCCQILHDKLGLTASARASLGIYNTKDDLDKLNESINNCKKIFSK